MSLTRTLSERGKLEERAYVAFDKDDKETVITIMLGWMGSNRAKKMLDHLENTNERI